MKNRTIQSPRNSFLDIDTKGERVSKRDWKDMAGAMAFMIDKSRSNVKVFTLVM